MAATKDDLSRWFDEGIKANQKYMIVVCDTFDYKDYPVYTGEDNFKEQYQKHDGVNMQRIMEVYDLSKNKPAQLNEFNSFNLPPSFQKDAL
jgi:hypothetical protein